MSDQDNSEKQQQAAGFRPVAIADVVQPVPDTSSPDSKFSKTEDVERPMTRYERRSFVVSIVGVIVGIVVAVIYSLQLYQMKTATDASRRSAEVAAQALAISERAYVDIGDWIMGGFGVGQTTFAYRFSATGRTPANIIGGEIRMSIDSPIQMAPAEDKRLVQPLVPQVVSHLMQGQQIVTFPVEVPAQNQEAWAKVIAPIRAGAIYLGGEIRYRDAFDGTPVHVRHFSFICRGPNGQFTPNQLGLIVMNYEDDEK